MHQEHDAALQPESDPDERPERSRRPNLLFRDLDGVRGEDAGLDDPGPDDPTSDESDGDEQDGDALDGDAPDVDEGDEPGDEGTGIDDDAPRAQDGEGARDDDAAWDGSDDPDASADPDGSGHDDAEGGSEGAEMVAQQPEDHEEPFADVRARFRDRGREGRGPTPGSRDAVEAILGPLRRHYPKATEGTLFCVHKLQQDPDATIPDFRDEAALYDLKIGGRSLHSAKVLLGLAEEAPRRKRREPAVEQAAAEADPPVERAPSGARRKASTGGEDSLAARIADVVEAWQAERRSADVEPLRAALEEVLEIVHEALEDGEEA